METTDPFDDPEAMTIYIFPFEHSPLVLEIALALRYANVKTDYRDLWRCALHMHPVDPVCTTFVGLLLGLGTNVPYHPYELLQYIDGVYHQGGALWVRNGVGQWNLKSQTFLNEKMY